MFKDTNNTALVVRRMTAATGHRAIAGIFSPKNEEQAAKLGHQELGTRAPGSKQRQTVAPAFDQGEDAVVRELAANLDDAVDGSLAPQLVAELTAETLANNIRARIESNTPPPLEDATLAARRRRGITGTRTLVASGDMLKAIEHDVRDGEGSSDG